MNKKQRHKLNHFPGVKRKMRGFVFVNLRFNQCCCYTCVGSDRIERVSGGGVL